jgi:hypothetical protein
MIDAADVCYFYPWPTMSTAPSEMPATVSLADEEAVRRILVDTLGDGQQPDPSASIAARALSREVRACAHRAGALGLRGSQADVLGPERYELRHHTGGGPGLMQAANEGAKAAQASQGEPSIGIRVHLPFEQDVNPPSVRLRYRPGLRGRSLARQRG